MDEEHDSGTESDEEIDGTDLPSGKYLIIVLVRAPIKYFHYELVMSFLQLKQLTLVRQCLLDKLYVVHVNYTHRSVYY